MIGADEVICAVCEKPVKRAAALAHHGKWSHANASCFGKLMREQPSVREAGRQLGLFGGRRGGQ